MAGPRRQKGSGSNSQRPPADEHDEVPDETPEADKPYLSSKSGGVWWNDPRIVDLLGESIMANFNEFYPNWTSLPQERRNHMFNYFKDRVRCDDVKELRAGYEKYVKKRMRNYVYRASKKTDKPKWMKPACWNKIKERVLDPLFKEVSKKAQENRLKGGTDGKALPTHVLGRKSAARALDSLTSPEEAPFKLLELSKKNKKGEWISQKAEAIEREYSAKKAQLDAGELDMDEYQLYLESAGGFDKKGRVYGVGDVAREFFSPPTHRTRQDETPSYNPGVFSQTVKENVELKAQVSQLQTQQAMMMQKLQEQFGWSFPTETCNRGPDPSRRDDFSDDHGDAFGFGGTVPPV